jgi:hypothetical protein
MKGPHYLQLTKLGERKERKDGVGSKIRRKGSGNRIVGRWFGRMEDRKET